MPCHVTAHVHQLAQQYYQLERQQLTCESNKYTSLKRSARTSLPSRVPATDACKNSISSQKEAEENLKSHAVSSITCAVQLGHVRERTAHVACGVL
jgi:fatty acid/phospholipid biosynthesis enzyme